VHGEIGAGPESSYRCQSDRLCAKPAFARQLSENCVIAPVGNVNDVRRMVAAFRGEGVRAVGVRDPDKPGDDQQGLFALPGQVAPERLLVERDNLEHAEELIDGAINAFDRARAAGLGKEGSAWAEAVFQALAHELGLSRELLADRLTAAWLRHHIEDARELAVAIQQAL